MTVPAATASQAPAVPGDVARPLVRSGAASFAGFGVAALCGLLLTLVVARSLGAQGAGTFYVAVAVVTVAATVTRLGADTALVWALPRAAALGRAAESPSIVRVALVPVVVAGAVAGGALFVAAPVLGELLAAGNAAQLSTVLRVVSPALVVAAPMGVVLAGLRGLGGVGAFTWLQNVALPLSRLVAIAVAGAAGAGVVVVVALWSGPFLVVAVLGALLLRRGLVALRASSPATCRPRRQVSAELWRFSAARSGAAVLEVVLVWSDVLVVAALTSPAEAGVYAVASRFITSGTLVEAAMRVTVAPRVSRLLALGRSAEASRLNAAATSVIVGLSWPLYVVLVAGSPFVLRLFGDGFSGGATAMSILAAAMLVAMAVGNSQTMLLMSGRSAWQLANKGVAVAVNVALNVVLVPLWGIEGAAVAWAVTIIVDSVAVWLQVRLLVGLRTPMGAVLPLAAGALVCFGAPTTAVRLATEPGMAAVVAGILAGVVGYALLLWVLRRRLGLAPAVQALRKGAAPAAADEPRRGH